MEDESEKLPENIVNEPLVDYNASQKNRIAFFKSFEAATEADYDFYRNLSPEERMEIHYKLSITAFTTSQTNSNRRFSF